MSYTGSESLSLGAHVSISDITLHFKDKFEASKKLEVYVGSERKNIVSDGVKYQDKRRWVFDPEMELWPDSILRIQPYRHRTPRHPSTFLSEVRFVEIKAEDLLQSCTVPREDKGDLLCSGLSTMKLKMLEYNLDCENFKISMKISLNTFSTATELRQAVACKKELEQNGLRGVFWDALDVVGKILELGRHISAVNPAASAVVNALLFTCQVLQSIQTFHEGLLDLAGKIKQSLAEVAEIQDLATIKILKDTIVGIMEAVHNAAVYIQKYSGKGVSDKFWQIQFPRELEAFTKKFDSFHNALISGISSQNLVSQEENKLLANLIPLQPIQVLPNKCLPGTRKNILQAISLWLSNPGAPNIMWISGSPGAGKSAIASSVVSDLCEKVSSVDFFFKSGDAYWGNPASLWAAIAVQLANIDTSFRQSIVPAMRDGKASASKTDVNLHFRHLFEVPLQQDPAESSIQPMVVIVDALDEAGPPAQRGMLLSTLSKWAYFPPTFKLLVTSRREDDIEFSFQNISHCHFHLYTGDQVALAAQTSVDIELFFQKEFGNLAKRLPRLEPGWPSSKMIDQLTTKAAGLFIWATTVAKLVQNDAQPTELLNEILSGSNKEMNLDDLYNKVLSHVFGPKPNNRAIQTFQKIIGAIIVTKVPLNCVQLQKLLCLSDSDTSVDFILRDLSSVVSTDKSTQLIHICHQSFIDFLTDAKWGNEWFYINCEQHNRHLVQYCLQVMNADLRFNICGLKTSHHFNKDIPNLAECIETNISPQLKYSSYFWAEHMRETPILDSSSNMQKDLQKFLHNNLLSWLEVLSFTKEVPIAAGALNLLSKRLLNIDKGLSEFAADASRFCANMQQPISESTPHIYISCLTFSPEESQVAKHYSKMYPHNLGITGKEKYWPVLKNVFVDHTAVVRSVAFSSDGKYVVSGSDDKTVRVWDIEKGITVSGPFKGHSEPVKSVAFSPDGKYVVSGSNDGTVQVWNVEKGALAFGPFTEHNAWVLSVAFSPNGKYVAAGSRSKTILVWNVETGTIAFGPFLGHDDYVVSVAFSPNGKYIASGSDDHTIRLWNIETGTTAFSSIADQDHYNIVGSVAFSPDGKYVASGSFDGRFQVWDVEKGTIAFGPFDAQNSWVTCVAFSPDGKYVAAGSDNNNIAVWDIEKGIIAFSLEGHNQWVTSVGFSPDGRCIVSGCSDSTLRLWDVEKGITTSYEEHKKRIRSIAFSPDGRYLVSGSSDRTMWVWDIEKGTAAFGPFEGYTRFIMAVAFSPDGKYVASGSCYEQIRVWDIKKGTTVSGPFEGHIGWVTSVAFSPDGKHIASGSIDKTIRVWDIEKGDIAFGPFEGHTNMVNSVKYSPDGKYIVSGSHDNTVRVWDVEKGIIAFGPFEGHQNWVQSVAFSPDGKYVASGSHDKTVRVWDIEKGTTVFGPFEGHSGLVMSVAFSPDGRYIVSGSFDMTSRVWDIEKGTIAFEPFGGHHDRVVTVAFSPDGKYIASGSYDKSIRLWNIEKATPVFERYDDSVALAVSGSGDKLIQVWNPDKGTGVFSAHQSGTISHSQTIKIDNDTGIGPRNLETPSALHEQDVVFKKNSKLDKVGWMCNAETSALLFWLPPHDRHRILYPDNSYLVGTMAIKLDFSNFKPWEQW